MIHLKNGHSFEYIVASGALAFDGKGWPWDIPLVWSKIIHVKDLTIVSKTVTFKPRKGNFNWLHPWTSIALLENDSVVNKVDLTNPGYEWWVKNVGQKVDRKKLSLVGSIFGSEDELVKMAEAFNSCDLVAIEVNPSCPNTGDGFNSTQEVINSVKAVAKISKHPVIVKVSVAQDYLEIAKGLLGVVEAISFNSVPWEIAFPGKISPLWKLEKKVGGGGGGVSGRAAQKFNWEAMQKIHSLIPELPLIASSIMEFEDLEKAKKIGSSAVSFGVRFMKKPWMPTRIIKEDKKKNSF